ncbi:ATP-binding protein [Chloroflexota bacterium]
MTEKIYRKLAKHLDKLPGGFPPTEDGLELRILRRLFTPPQAELALQLNLIPETAPVVARRAGLPAEQTAEMLAEMADLGLIYDIQPSEGPPQYMAYQFVVGIWEFQVNRLEEDFVRDVDKYLEILLEPNLWKEAPQLRTIPIGESIPDPSEILPYEQAEKLVQASEKLAVADCICRKESQLKGEGCDKPLETCLILGGGADFYMRHGIGRQISKDEAMAILETANEAGLVLQPSNSQKAGNICACCGDCCGVLRNLKRFPNPGTLVSTPYLAVVDDEICSACETCVERCQMEAIEVNGYATVLVNRCIGCGLCVTTCETGALSLVRKPQDEQAYVPKRWSETLLRLGRQRGVIKNLEMVKMGVRSKVDRLLTSD